MLSVATGVRTVLLHACLPRLITHLRQTEHKLYMVFDFFNGGELYHYLSEGGRFTEARAR